MSVQDIATATAPEKRLRSGLLPSWIRAANLVGLSALVILIVVPSVPPPVGTGLDPSWRWGLNMAHLNRLHFGPDILFTYGPLGYLAFPTFPEAGVWAPFAFAWTIAVITAYALWQVIRALRLPMAWLYTTVFWLCSIPLLANPLSPLERITFATVALSLSVALRIEAAPWFALHLLSFLAALALLTKSSLIAPLAIGTYFTLLLTWKSSAKGLARWRHAALFSLVFLASFLALFCWSNGTLRGIGLFLRGSMEIVSGYSDAMAVAGPLWIVVLAAGSCFVLFVLVPLISGEPRQMALAVAPVAILAFQFFKSGMVREDGHVVPFQFELALASLLLLSFAKSMRSRDIVAEFAQLSLCLGLVVQMAVWPQLFPGEWDRLTGVAVVGDLRAFASWPTTVRALGKISEEALGPARIPAEFGFAPLLNGESTAAFPYQVDYIRANHLAWRPLPVIQTYNAYTDQLDAINARQLSGGHAPQEILLSWSPIDEHHPFYESPQTWQELLNRYDLQLKVPGLYVLGHRDTPRFAEPISEGETETRWEQPTPLPKIGEDEILLMQGDIQANLKGSLGSAFLRAPATYVQATLSSGQKVTSRLVRNNLRGGVIASYWPNGLEDLIPTFLNDRPEARRRVVSLMFRTDVPERFQPVIRIHWWRMKASLPPTRDSLPQAPRLRLTQLWSPAGVPPVVLNAEFHRQRDFLGIKSVNVDPQCSFTIGADLGQYKTIMIRAKYEVTDRIDLFFGPQVNGRGVAGLVPVAGSWIDAYFNVAANRYWAGEHGSLLRFDPVSELGVNSTVEIAGIWGSPDSLPFSGRAFFATPASQGTQAPERLREGKN